jgi:tRNA A37 methylthiotransferase MiaB
MGRRYAAADYAATVDRARAAIRGVAIHGDVIVGAPTEDDAAWQRSLAFIRSVGFAGIHSFRYSARPGTAATRMAGQVDEATKKARAATLLAVAADARERWARTRVGTIAEVLFETRLDDGRWVGHDTDHTLVAAAALGAGLLENAIGRVALSGVDPARRDRVAGVILSVSPPTGSDRGIGPDRAARRDRAAANRKSSQGSPVHAG